MNKIELGVAVTERYGELAQSLCCLSRGGAFELDQWGVVQTDELKHTSRNHVFAIGDVPSKRFRQITTATCDGTVAAMALAHEPEAETHAKVAAAV